MYSTDRRPEPEFQAVEANTFKERFKKKQTCIQSFNSYTSHSGARDSVQWTYNIEKHMRKRHFEQK